MIVAALLATALPAVAKERAKIATTLENSGTVTAAAGDAKAVFSPGRSRLQLRLNGLQPSTEHTLVVGGLAEATFTSSASGTAKLKFQSPAAISRWTSIRAAR